MQWKQWEWSRNIFYVCKRFRFFFFWDLRLGYIISWVLWSALRAQLWWKTLQVINYKWTLTDLAYSDSACSWTYWTPVCVLLMVWTKLPSLLLAMLDVDVGESTTFIQTRNWIKGHLKDFLCFMFVHQNHIFQTLSHSARTSFAAFVQLCMSRFAALIFTDWK